MGVTDEELIKRVLPVTLVGDAARWFQLQQPFRSKEDFVLRFRNEFLPPDYEYRVLEELQRRTQHPEESLVEFIRPSRTWSGGPTRPHLRRPR